MVSLLCNPCHAFPVKVDCHFWRAIHRQYPLKAAFRPDDEGTKVPLERDARRSSMIGTRFFKEHTHPSHVKYVFENGKYNNSCLTSYIDNNRRHMECLIEDGAGEILGEEVISF